MPPNGRTLRLATRASPLALAQARAVAALVERAHRGLRAELVTVTTQGDELADVSLDRIGGQGVFTSEVERAVLEGRADAAVHSAKDLPAAMPAGLVLGAVPERADPRDALVGRRLADLSPGARVATGSARRRAQLANVRPDLTFVDLRGNIGTRLARAERGDVEAVVVAAAALERLGLAPAVTDRLSPRVALPQVGQGALAVQCAADGPVPALLAAIDHEPSRRAVTAERALLGALGGSCSLPVAGWARPAEAAGPLVLDGMLASADGRIVVYAAGVEGEGAAGADESPEALGERVAAALRVERGADALELRTPGGAP